MGERWFPIPNKHYLAGRKKEYEVIELLEAESYICFRTAGSHTPVDVLAFSEIEDTGVAYAVWVQVKKSTAPMSNDEWNLLYQKAIQCGVTPVLAEYTPRKGIVFYQLLGTRRPREQKKPWTEWQP